MSYRQGQHEVDYETVTGRFKTSHQWALQNDPVINRSMRLRSYAPTSLFSPSWSRSSCHSSATWHPLSYGTEKRPWQGASSSRPGFTSRFLSPSTRWAHWLVLNRPQHIAAEKISGVERGTAWILERIRLVGPQATRWAEGVIEARGVE